MDTAPLEVANATCTSTMSRPASEKPPMIDVTTSTASRPRDGKMSRRMRWPSARSCGRGSVAVMGAVECRARRSQAGRDEEGVELGPEGSVVPGGLREAAGVAAELGPQVGVVAQAGQRLGHA